MKKYFSIKGEEQSLSQPTEHGAVMVEFLVIFITFFTLLLCAFQIFFVYLARVNVQRAAISAARSGAVVIPDHPQNYGGGGGQSVGGGAPYTIGNGVVNLGPYLSWAGFGSTANLTPSVSTRLGVIRTAAAYPLIPHHIGNISGANPVVRTAAINAQMAVVFPVNPGSTRLRRTFLPSDTLHVRVTYGFSCNIPLASKLVCLPRTDTFDGDFSSTGTSRPAGDSIVISAEASMPLMNIGVLGEL